MEMNEIAEDLSNTKSSGSREKNQKGCSEVDLFRKRRVGLG